MQQMFRTRPSSVRDFEEWEEKGELVLAPKFQRRDVWPDKARSYLLDTIIRGKPIPKIYMRQDINPRTRRTTREIVDGQQRLRTVLSYLKDGFKISKTHNEEYGGKYFSELDEDTQRHILRYEFSVDLLHDVPDREVYDIFARLNTYSMTLNAQELRHAQWFGEFRTSVYRLANEFMTFWQDNEVFSDRKILRMAEAEFVSELLIAMSVGIRGRSKSFIDKFYEDHDDRFPRRKTLERQFRHSMDDIGGIMARTLARSRLSEPRLLYPFFCAVHHMQFGLPEMTLDRVPFKGPSHPKLRIAVGKIDQIFEKLEAEADRETRIQAGEPPEEVYEEVSAPEESYEEGEAEEELLGPSDGEATKAEELDPLSREERRFYEAYVTHWVHAENRRIRTEYMCKLMLDALRQ